MHCSTRYNTCSLLLANRTHAGDRRERLPPRNTIGTQRPPPPAPGGICAGSSQGHTSGSKPPPRPRDRPAWYVRHAIAYSGTNEAISVGSALATPNNGTSSCVRRPTVRSIEYRQRTRTSGVCADRVTAADQILLRRLRVRARLAPGTMAAFRNTERRRQRSNNALALKPHRAFDGTNRHPPHASQTSHRDLSSGISPTWQRALSPSPRYPFGSKAIRLCAVG